jgi:3'-5' exoribonuclease
VVTDYRKVKRISVESLEVTTAFDRADMLPHGTHDPEETLAEFRRVAGTISTPALRAVLRSVFGDKSFLDRFVTSPASEGAHHVYLGGLLEHTVSVAGLCETFAARFAHVDRDLLVAAALLHDIGVVDELSWELTIASTDAGRLLGHQVLGDRRLHAACGRFDRRGTAEVLLRLSHALLAHHAATSDARHSIVPATVEAMLLAHADAMDISASEFAVLSAGSAAVGERWTDDRNRLGRRLLVSSDASLEPVRVPA